MMENIEEDIWQCLLSSAVVCMDLHTTPHIVHIHTVKWEIKIKNKALRSRQLKYGKYWEQAPTLSNNRVVLFRLSHDRKFERRWYYI